MRNLTFMRHKFLVLPVKKMLKSVHIYGSYRKIKTGVQFFWNTLYVTLPASITGIHDWPVSGTHVYIVSYSQVIYAKINWNFQYCKRKSGKVITVSHRRPRIELLMTFYSMKLCTTQLCWFSTALTTGSPQYSICFKPLTLTIFLAAMNLRIINQQFHREESRVPRNSTRKSNR